MPFQRKDGSDLTWLGNDVLDLERCTCRLQFAQFVDHVLTITLVKVDASGGSARLNRNPENRTTAGERVEHTPLFPTSDIQTFLDQPVGERRSMNAFGVSWPVRYGPDVFF